MPAGTVSSRARLSIIAALLVCAFVTPSSVTLRAESQNARKLGPLAAQRAAHGTGRSTVIIRAANGGAARAAALEAGGTLGRSLPGINGHVVTLPDAALARLAENPAIERISLDRVAVGANERTGATVGATEVRQELGLDGAGIGIAVIDSGIAYHDDLADASGPQRVDRFVDFVGGQSMPYDDYGHGTHVAGIIAGNGYDSDGKRTGIAPAARLIVLKALDGTGTGRISDVIAAIEYAIENRDALNIRVINLSIASAVYESYETDPLTVAALHAVQAGIVVVAAAGNNGVSPAGFTRYGGITAPGNAPWVLTVGGSTHMGTTDRADDSVAPFSSRGPTAVDTAAKPDLVAPSVGIESLAAPGSALYGARTPYLLSGTVLTSSLPYLSMSGTSMASPVVAGTVALMLQANPQMTPNADQGGAAVHLRGGFPCGRPDAGRGLPERPGRRGPGEVPRRAGDRRISGHDGLEPSGDLGQLPFQERPHYARRECVVDGRDLGQPADHDRRAGRVGRPVRDELVRHDLRPVDVDRIAPQRCLGKYLRRWRVRSGLEPELGERRERRRHRRLGHVRHRRHRGVGNDRGRRDGGLGNVRRGRHGGVGHELHERALHADDLETVSDAHCSLVRIDRIGCGDRRR